MSRFDARLWRVALALLVLAAPPARAQQPVPSVPSVPAQPDSLTPAMRQAIVDTVAARFVRFYAIADTGQLIADHLRQRLRAGAYDTLTHPTRFSDAVTRDMQAVNGDRHLFLHPHGMVPVEPLDATRIEWEPTAPTRDHPPHVIEMARRTAFGLGRIEVLTGNVGYFEIRNFSLVDIPASEAMVAALQYLEHADAIIIDVRDNGGGSAWLSNFLISHFVGADTLHSLDVDVRSANVREQRYTLANVPGPRRPDVPIYILTSRGTISAAEDFAFVMRNLGRATLVGEPTIGAGRNNYSFDAGYGFAASISVSTVRDPKTGAEWEGVGVQPHVSVPPRTALTAAHQHALSLLAERAPNDRRRRELVLAGEFVGATATPHDVPIATLRAYVGTYGDERMITLENDALVYRPNARTLGRALVPLSDSTFALGSYTRVAFERGPKGLLVRLTQPTGAALVLPRTGPAPTVRSEH